MESKERKTGKIIWYSSMKQYGFIVPDDGSKDIFIHRKNISKSKVFGTLEEGEKVDFLTEETEKGISAKNLCLIEEDTVKVEEPIKEDEGE